MKRTFLAKRNALLSAANFSWGFVALAFAVLVLLMRLLFPNAFLHALAPAFGISGDIADASHTFLSSFGDTATLAALNERLARENAALASENQALLEKEASLAALSGVPASGIPAGVVSRPPESPYDTLVLAAGTAAGATPGMEAFGEGGVPLGVVSAVTKDFSRVTLFSAPNAVTHGWVGKEHVPVSISGGGAGAFTATLSRLANIAIGDTVFVPGPGMLPIGTVVRIDSDPSAPGITLRILPRANPFTLAWVELRNTGMMSGAFTLATTTP